MSFRTKAVCSKRPVFTFLSSDYLIIYRASVFALANLTDDKCLRLK